MELSASETVYIMEPMGFSGAHDYGWWDLVAYYYQIDKKWFRDLKASLPLPKILNTAVSESIDDNCILKCIRCDTCMLYTKLWDSLYSQTL